MEQTHPEIEGGYDTDVSYPATFNLQFYRTVKEVCVCVCVRARPFVRCDALSTNTFLSHVYFNFKAAFMLVDVEVSSEYTVW